MRAVLFFWVVSSAPMGRNSTTQVSTPTFNEAQKVGWVATKHRTRNFGFGSLRRESFAWPQCMFLADESTAGLAFGKCRLRSLNVARTLRVRGLPEAFQFRVHPFSEDGPHRPRVAGVHDRPATNHAESAS